MEPSHEAIHAAAATVDAELAAWTARTDSYILRPASRPELAHHRLWFLIPEDAPHPLSVYIAMRDEAAPFVTSGRPEAVWRVIAAEPALAASPALPVVVHDLLRDQGRHQQVVEGTGSTRAEGDGWVVTFDVRDRASGDETWTVTLQESKSALSVAKER